MAYRPTGNKVLIERIAAKKETSGGIILKTTEEADRAKIIAIGPDVTEVAVDELVSKGFDTKMGARPLQRKINDLIKVPLSKKILFEIVAPQSTVVVDFKDDKFVFSTIAATDTTYRIDENGYIVLEKTA